MPIKEQAEELAKWHDTQAKAWKGAVLDDEHSVQYGRTARFLRTLAEYADAIMEDGDPERILNASNAVVDLAREGKE